MNYTSLQDYLNALRLCNDPKILETEFQIYDNWPILFYGDKEAIFAKITTALKNSPGEIKDRWQCAKETKLGQWFHHESGKVQLQIQKWTRHDYGEEDQIGSLEHRVWLMFHPLNVSMGDAESFQAIANAIPTVAKYLVEERIVARFPKI